jgi:hypothetical protein
MRRGKHSRVRGLVIMSVVTLIGRLVTLTIVVTVLMPIVIGLVVEVTIVEVGMTVVTTEGDKLKNSS